MPVRSTYVHRRQAIEGPDAERPPAEITGARLHTGDLVEVRNRFEDRWIHGFSVAASCVEGYQLRRASDGAVLPAWFPPTMVRRRRG